MATVKTLTLFRPLMVEIPGLDLDQLRKQAKKKQARAAKRAAVTRQKQSPATQPPESKDSRGKDPLCVIFPNGLGI